jgi:hypothetical protein
MVFGGDASADLGGCEHVTAVRETAEKVTASGRRLAAYWTL